jgi:uncharacterized membrane protein
MEPPNPKAGLGLVGAGAACAACCAGPILGFLAATGIASVLGAVVFGVVGLIVVLAVAAGLWRRRRRRQRCEPPDAEPTPVAAPRLMTRT